MIAALAVIVALVVVLTVTQRKHDEYMTWAQDAYQRGYSDALRYREPDVSVYQRGFMDGYEIGRTDPETVRSIMREPVKPEPVKPDARKERERLQALMQNIAVYDGTERGQQDV